MSAIPPRPLGQDRALARLERMAAGASGGAGHGMPHALLFAGPGGVGKYPSALWWARQLKCAKQGECSPACADCKRIGAGSHPDVTVLAPEAPGKAIGIDEVRELIRLMALKCVGRGPRIAIVREAHELSHEAQSAFLKLLEEPPGHAVIVLVTENPAGLLQTVRSRCQTLRFGAVSADDIAKLLVASGRDPDTAGRAAALSMGSVGRALSLTPELIEDRDQMIAAIEALRGGDPGELEPQMTDLVERTKQGRAGLEDLFQWTMERIEEALGQGAAVESTPSVGPGADPATADPQRLLLRAERIRWTLDALDRNANAKLAIRDLLYDLENG
jgi:DNA polymerase III subunit delta'